MQERFHPVPRKNCVVQNPGLVLVWRMYRVLFGTDSLVFNKDEDDSFIPSPFFISNSTILRFLQQAMYTDLGFKKKKEYEYMDSATVVQRKMWGTEYNKFKMGLFESPLKCNTCLFQLTCFCFCYWYDIIIYIMAAIYVLVQVIIRLI